jgi:hypothetical protein
MAPEKNSPETATSFKGSFPAPGQPAAALVFGARSLAPRTADTADYESGPIDVTGAGRSRIR